MRYWWERWRDWRLSDIPRGQLRFNAWCSIRGAERSREITLRQVHERPSTLLDEKGLGPTAVQALRRYVAAFVAREARGMDGWQEWSMLDTRIIIPEGLNNVSDMQVREMARAVVCQGERDWGPVGWICWDLSNGDGWDPNVDYRTPCSVAHGVDTYVRTFRLVAEAVEYHLRMDAMLHGPLRLSAQRLNGTGWNSSRLREARAILTALIEKADTSEFHESEVHTQMFDVLHNLARAWPLPTYCRDRIKSALMHAEVAAVQAEAVQ